MLSCAYKIYGPSTCISEWSAILVDRKTTFRDCCHDKSSGRTPARIDRGPKQNPERDSIYDNLYKENTVIDTMKNISLFGEVCGWGWDGGGVCVPGRGWGDYMPKFLECGQRKTKIYYQHKE